MARLDNLDKMVVKRARKILNKRGWHPYKIEGPEGETSMCFALYLAGLKLGTSIQQRITLSNKLSDRAEVDIHIWSARRGRTEEDIHSFLRSVL